MAFKLAQTADNYPTVELQRKPIDFSSRVVGLTTGERRA